MWLLQRAHIGTNATKTDQLLSSAEHTVCAPWGLARTCKFSALKMPVPPVVLLMFPAPRISVMRRLRSRPNFVLGGEPQDHGLVPESTKETCSWGNENRILLSVHLQLQEVQDTRATKALQAPVQKQSSSIVKAFVESEHHITLSRSPFCGQYFELASSHWLQPE
mmetsp:Transcript_122906/g.292345  ORF Transcript_122906/g.292345 Transcript_122906/m.292345 type:complete len:165 (-) Transcript_122906:546-1040(-)